MRYNVEWYYETIQSWMDFPETFFTRRGAIKFLVKQMKPGSKLRIIDTKTGDVTTITMTVEKKEPNT